ncbi:MAG: hypothetical protein C0448_09695 [Sphingobacteriaceae bacterium]|nr:hypothetical protein [Sphingobacteriaceae bacterium]
MNWFTEIQEIINLYLTGLKFKYNKTKSQYERDEKKYAVLVYTFGLEGKNYSKEEIALLLDLSEERVRQIIIQSINEIRKHIFQPDTRSLFGKTYDSLNRFKIELEEQQILSYNKFIETIQKELGIELVLLKPLIDLVFAIFDFKVLKITLHHLRNNDLVLTTKKIIGKDFVSLCYATYLTIEKNASPIEVNDLYIGVKRKLENITFTKQHVILACKVVDSISSNENQSQFNLVFEKLSSSNDMAYRILFEKKRKMKLAEIQKEINHRLIGFDRKPVSKVSLNTQMNMDSRLTSIGKTGIWALKEWNEVNKTMYDLITETLVLFNKPLSKKEIFNHIFKSRPEIPPRSLSAVIYNERYLKLKGNKFILADWKELYKKEIIQTTNRNTHQKENPVASQIKEQIINLFSENNSTSILLPTIIKTLNKNFKFPKTSIYKVISENPEFETKLVTKNKKIVSHKSVKNPKVNPTKSTSVFVSYSWEGEQHKNKVISFVDFLRKKGFEADMDVKYMQEETALDFNRLMHIGILKYDKVIVILSESFKSKAENFEGGVGKEYKFITGDIENNPKKYILTSFTKINKAIINKIVPADLKGREIVDLTQDETDNFATLFSKLANEGQYKFSEVAKNTPLVEEKKIEPFTLK